MKRLTNQPLNTDTKRFYNGAYPGLTTNPNFNGIAGYDNRVYNAQTEAVINTNLKMRCSYENEYNHPDDSDQLFGFQRYDCTFVLKWNTTTDTADIGTKSFTLPGINRFLHESKLEYEEAFRENPEIELEKFDVAWAQKWISFDGILNDDKSSYKPNGEMEKTATILNQGITRMPCCFNDDDVPAFNRLGFMVKEVCVSGKTTYVTDSEKPAGVTLKPPADGYVTRIIPTAIKTRYPRMWCTKCDKPPAYRAFMDNCLHTDKILLYEVNLNLDHEKVVNWYYDSYFKKTDETVNEKRKKLLAKFTKNGYLVEKNKVKLVKKAHYIPFGMTEQGYTSTVKSPNIYRPNSEINCIQYQLNEHIEFWNRSC